MKTKILIAALSIALVSGSAQASLTGDYNITETWIDGATFVGTFSYDDSIKSITAVNGYFTDTLGTAHLSSLDQTYLQNGRSYGFDGWVWDQFLPSANDNSVAVEVNLDVTGIVPTLWLVADRGQSVGSSYWDERLSSQTNNYLDSLFNSTLVSYQITPSAVQLPPSVAMFATGLLGLGFARRKTNTPALAF